MNAIRSQRGVGTLGVTLLLMSFLSLALLYAHRGLLFEQRSAANQQRAAVAFETTQAGLEWATAMLNDPRTLDDHCELLPGGTSFRDRYLGFEAGSAAPTLLPEPACRRDGAAWACRCMTAAGAPSPEAGDGPRFKVGFTALAAVPAAVHVAAQGCSGPGQPCDDAAALPSDATAAASVVLKHKPGLLSPPTAAITAGGSVQLGGTMSLVNRDARRGGRLVTAGGLVTVGGDASLEGPAGTPVETLLASNEPTLAGRTSDEMFAALFGATVEGHSQWPTVRRISGASARERGAALLAAAEQGYGAFHVDGDLSFDVSIIGTPERPVLIVSSHGIACLAACRVHGLLVGDLDTRPASDLQQVTVHGAVVTRGHHVQAGDGGVVYDGDILERLSSRTGAWVRMIGGWKDF
jgi:hypothetical protein